jgi:hypothetical protein
MTDGAQCLLHIAMRVYQFVTVHLAGQRSRGQPMGLPRWWLVAYRSHALVVPSVPVGVPDLLQRGMCARFAVCAG